MNVENQEPVTIYTDGSCSPNPGPGGWAAIILIPGQEPKELVGGEPDTTNNRMELRAALEAQKYFTESQRIDLYTDSNYLRKGITEWLPIWVKRNWQTNGKTDVKNQDLWQALAEQLNRHEISWHWTKGHAGDKWNERADVLAGSAIPKKTLPLDDEQAIHVFTAASFSGKKQCGGWAVVLRHQDNLKELSQGIKNTSSNRMHIQSAIEGLKAIKKTMPIHLYTTSSYLKDGATSWTRKWKARNWNTQDGKPVSHRDLWEELARLVHNFNITWHVVSKEDMPEEMKTAKKRAGETIHKK